jgi:hypothetical protein
MIHDEMRHGAAALLNWTVDTIYIKRLCKAAIQINTITNLIQPLSCVGEACDLPFL